MVLSNPVDAVYFSGDDGPSVLINWVILGTAQSLGCPGAVVLSW